MTTPYDLPNNPDDPNYANVMAKRSWLKDRVEIWIKADAEVLENWRKQNPTKKPDPEFVIEVRGAVPLFQQEFESLLKQLEFVLAKEFSLIPPAPEAEQPTT